MLNNVYLISTILAVIGALNWGLVGLFNFNLVTYVLGTDTTLTKAVYVIVGAAGCVVLASLLRK